MDVESVSLYVAKVMGLPREADLSHVKYIQVSF